MGRGLTSNNVSKRRIKLFFTALSKQSGQRIEKETAVDEREVLQHFSFSKPIESSMTSLDLHHAAYMDKIIERADD